MVTYDRRTGKPLREGTTIDYSGIKDPSRLQYSATTGQRITGGTNPTTITADALASANPLTVPQSGGKTNSAATTGLEFINSTIEAGIKADEERATTLRNTKDTSLGALNESVEALGKLPQKEDEIFVKEGGDIAKKDYDLYTSQLRSEQKSLRDRMMRLRETNPEGLSKFALQTSLDDMEREGLSKQADIAILQNAALDRYDTATAIAARKVAAETEYLKSQIDIRKNIYEDNKAEFTLAEQRVIEAKLKQQDREYNRAVAEKSAIENIKIEYLKNGGSPSAFEGKNFATTDEALKALGSGLAVSQNDFVNLGTSTNPNYALIDKRTGRVVKSFGGGGGNPKVTTRTVNGKPVTGYTLEAGDDPYFIAQQYGTDMSALKAVNPDIKDWHNIKPGATINVPLNKDDAFVQKMLATDGGKALTDTSIQKLDKGLTVLGQLGVLQENIKNEKTSPIVGYFRDKNPWDNKAQVIKAQLNAIVPNLARGVYGEVGVLTDNDIAQYSKTIPTMKSETEVRNAILYITLDMIGKSIGNTLNVNASAGRDVSGFVDIYTEMQNTKNSLLSTIPGAGVPGSIQQGGASASQPDNFLNGYTAESIRQSIPDNDFFNSLGI